MTIDSKINQLRTMIADSDQVVVFTGAGISTESGIPDFRSPGGIWDNNQPVYFQDFISSEDMRREAWRRKFAVDSKITPAEPNAGHLAIATLVTRGKVSSIITQNIDGLHQKSGVPDEYIIELHGNGTYAKCLDCKKRYELEEIRQNFQKNETLTSCQRCNGIIKSATISFGQPMPVEEMEMAKKETLACDLFLAMGSSLVVFPAAGFPEMAVANGAKLVIINREPTEMDSIADLVLHTEIGPTLSETIQ